jgi:type I restriction enzyme S subunit
VEWLGEIPKDWKALLIKREFYVTLGKMLTNEPRTEQDTLEYYVKAANIQWSGVNAGNLKKMWFSPTEKEKLRLADGDLLVSEGGDVGRAAIWRHADIDCYIQNAVNRIRGRSGAHEKFLYYWFSVIKSSGLIDVICNKSTIAHYTAEKVEATEFVCPPYGEQKLIVSYLDRETARIDNLIAEKQNFINLLKEKRQALISHVVTKGLDPNVKMKDSGVEWIVEVPERWTKTRLKFHVAKIIDTEHRTIPFIDDSDYLVVRTSDIREGELLQDQCRRTDSDSFQEWTRRGVPLSGDLILTREAPVGEACIVPEGINVCLGQRTVLIRATNNLLAEYLLLVIYSSLTKGFIDNASMGSTVKHLNMADIPNTPLLLPNIEEQYAIVDYAKGELTKVNDLRNETLASIELLREHRTALISAAVTGKIDVRNLGGAQPC